MEGHTMRRSKQTAVAARSVSVLVPVIVSVLVASGLRAVGAQVPSDPCAQLTAAEVSAALGETEGRHEDVLVVGQQADASGRLPHVLAAWRLEHAQDAADARRHEGERE